jgi:hypothetical protein
MGEYWFVGWMLDFCSSRLSFYTRIGALFRRVVIGAVERAHQYVMFNSDVMFSRDRRVLNLSLPFHIQKRLLVGSQ